MLQSRPAAHPLICHQTPQEAVERTLACEAGAHITGCGEGKIRGCSADNDWVTYVVRWLPASEIRSSSTGSVCRYPADESGQTMAEYGIILALVAVIAMVAFTALQGTITGMLGGITAALP